MTKPKIKIGKNKFEGKFTKILNFINDKFSAEFIRKNCPFDIPSI